MPIQSITRTAFDQLHPRRSASSWIQEEMEWFAERSRIFIGYIARNLPTDDWLFVVEGRDEHGQFHEIESGDHIATQQEARTLVERTMNEILGRVYRCSPEVGTEFNNLFGLVCSKHARDHSMTATVLR